MTSNGVSAENAQLPLNGVVMCCTSIPAEQRSELAALAEQMGAINKLDLTADVTHLVVGNTDTPKYKYVAKERPDVRVLLPDWIRAVRERWISGTDELDLTSLECEYRVPTFYNLRICVTGFEDQAIRKRIEELVKANGAEYDGDLSKDITHLIAVAPEGQKYRYAKRWGIKIVTIQWLEQSFERGMILEETLFDPLLEPHELGKGAWTRRAISATYLGKRTRNPNESFAAAGQVRKLRRSASSRFDSQSDGFWTDIVSARPSTEDVEAISKWDEERGVNESMLAYGQPSAITSVINPFEDTRQMLPAPKGMFSGEVFLLYGFDAKKTTILETHLSSHGGKVISLLTEDQDLSLSRKCHILFPHALHPSTIPETLRLYNQHFVTDLWLEKCLHTKEHVDPESCPVYRPFPFPVRGFQNLVISSTAFQGIDLLHLGKTVQLIGGKYDEFLTRKTSILVCNNSSMSRDKIKHALEWSIPAVSSDWLWDSIKSSTAKDLKPYLVYPAAQQHLQLVSTEAAIQVDTNVNPSNNNKVSGDRSDSVTNKEAQTRDNTPMAQTSEMQPQAPFFEDDEPEYIVPIDDDETQGDPAQENPVPDHATILDTNTATASLPRKPLPLQERSPNSPTKPQAYTYKLNHEKELLQQAQDREILSDTLQTILSRQKSSGNACGLQRSASSGSARGSGNRKERRLLGRATSNLSARSGMAGGPVNIDTNRSRASSIDTLNTNGLGTPIEGLPPGPLPASLVENGKDDQSVLNTTPLMIHDELLAADDDEQDPAHETLQMTQVRYEDPEAGRWRAKLLRKITASKNGQTPAVTENDTDEDAILVNDAPRAMLLEDDPNTSRIATSTGRRTRQQRAI